MKLMLQVKQSNHFRQLFLIINLILTIRSISAQEFKADSDYQNFYQTYCKQSSVKTKEDSLVIASFYKNYLALYDSARINAKNAVPNIYLNTCNFILYLKTIDFLKDCISYDSILTVKKVKQDNYFDGIRNEYEIRVLFYGLCFENSEDVSSFIVNKTYSTSAPGSSYYPITTLTLYENYIWEMSYHKNSEEMWNYWHLGLGNEPELIIGTKKGSWKLEGHSLILFDQFKKETQVIKLTQPNVIDEFYYPDPNNMSGENEVRHYWKCGKCGCK